MNIRAVDPISDKRWSALLEKHPAAGIFHSPGWLEALRRTYSYQPVVYAGVEREGELTGGIPFCNIHSFLTGRRIVSLPFSDHCQPLTSNAEELNALLSAARNDVGRRGLKYLELRPLSSNEAVLENVQLTESRTAVVHRLDLTGGREKVLDGFHKTCILRAIRNPRNHLLYEEGRSDSLLAGFYRLLLLTRRKHQLPPQPFAWFRNLRDCLNESLLIRIVSKNETPIAAAITLSFKQVVTYKYSCSDPAFKMLGGTVHLIWRIIQDALEQHATELDFGRSDLDNPGLITFKDRWGAARFPLTYYRYPAMRASALRESPVASAAKRLLTKVPDSMFTAVGGLFYRHVG